MLQICSGIYILLAVISILLFRETMPETLWHKIKKDEYDSG